MPVIDKLKEAVGAGASHKHDAAPASGSSEAQTLAALPKRDSPVYDRRLITVIFVLGGPGVGACAWGRREGGYGVLRRSDDGGAGRQGHPVREAGQRLWVCAPLWSVSRGSERGTKS